MKLWTLIACFLFLASLGFAKSVSRLQKLVNESASILAGVPNDSGFDVQVPSQGWRKLSPEDLRSLAGHSLSKKELQALGDVYLVDGFDNVLISVQFSVSCVQADLEVQALGFDLNPVQGVTPFNAEYDVDSCPD